MSRTVVPVVVFGLAAAILWGCGGGGVSGGTTGGSGGTTGGGTTGGAAAAQRVALQSAIDTEWASLPHKNHAADAQSMFNFLKGQKGVVATGIAPDQSIWCTAADGVGLVIVNNEPYTDNVPPSGASPHTAGLNTLSGTENPAVVPTGDKALLVNMFGSLEATVEDPRFAFNAFTPGVGITDILGSAGYSNNTPNNLSIANMRSLVGLQGPKPSVLFTGCHGCLWGQTTHLCLLVDQSVPQTRDSQGHLITDVKAEMSDATLWSDLHNPVGLPRVLEATGDYWSPNINFRREWHYAITASFVRRYWSFAPNSFWYNASCDGFVDPDFRQAAESQGLGTYAGWTDEVVRADSARAGVFAFDRMTGANKYQPATPPNRPFGSMLVAEDLHKKNMDVSHPAAGVTSNLKFESVTSSQECLLVPSLSSVNVQEGTKTLELTGDFGDDPGSSDRSITVGGSGVSGTTFWIQNVINVKGISSSATGNTTVTIGDHKSNAIPLTKWNGVIHAIVSEDARPNVKVDFKMTVDFRADGHMWRSAPDIAPDTFGGHGTTMQSSSCDWTASGSGTISSAGTTDTLTYKGNGSVPLQGSSGANGGNYWGGSWTVNPKTNMATLDIVAFTLDVQFTEVLTDAQGHSTTSSGKATSGTSVHNIMVTLDPSSLNGKTGSFPPQDDGAYTTRVTWQTISASGAPNSDTPR